MIVLIWNGKIKNGDIYPSNTGLGYQMFTVLRSLGCPGIKWLLYLENYIYYISEKPLCHENDKENEEKNQNSENFNHQPPVGGHATEVLEDLSVTSLNIQGRILHIRIDPQHHLLLFLDHVRQLLEDSAELYNSRFDVLHGVCSGMKVVVGDVIASD